MSAESLLEYDFLFIHEFALILCLNNSLSNVHHSFVVTYRCMYVKQVLSNEGGTVVTSHGKTISQVFQEAGIKVKLSRRSLWSTAAVATSVYTSIFALTLQI